MRTFSVVAAACIMLGSAVSAQSVVWTPSGLDTMSIRCLAINSNGHIFAGTGWHDGVPGGVFRSTDHGASWRQLDLATDILSLAISGGGSIFAGLGGDFGGWGIARSSDNGISWTHVMGFNYVNDFAMSPSGDVFTATSGVGDLRGAYRSSDNGDSWTKVNSGLGNTQLLAIAASPGGNVFAGTDAYGGGGVFLSADNGENWTPTGLTDVMVPALAINSAGHIFSQATFVSVGSDSSAVFRSTDHGESWTNLGLFNFGVNAFAFNSSGHIFVATDEGAFHSTTNGDSWVQINSGLANKLLRAIVVDERGVVYAGTESGVFRSVQQATSAREADDGVPAGFVLEQNHPNPFNPSTRISFTIPVLQTDAGGHVSGLTLLRIFDLLGREVVTLVNEEVGPGTYSVDWDAGSCAGGVYLYTLQFAGYCETRRLVLIR